MQCDASRQRKRADRKKKRTRSSARHLLTFTHTLDRPFGPRLSPPSYAHALSSSPLSLPIQLNLRSPLSYRNLDRYESGSLSSASPSHSHSSGACNSCPLCSDNAISLCRTVFFSCLFHVRPSIFFSLSHKHSFHSFSRTNVVLYSLPIAVRAALVFRSAINYNPSMVTSDAKRRHPVLY